jgi:hypothetical protein
MSIVSVKIAIRPQAMQCRGAPIQAISLKKATAGTVPDLQIESQLQDIMQQGLQI